MDDDSISRILAAMKKAPGATTIDMSRFEKEAFGYVRAKRALGGDIEDIIHICKEADDIRSRSRSSKHITTLNRLDEVLTDAQVFLDADPVTTRAITENCAPGRPDFRSALASGKSVVAEVRERFLNSTGFDGKTCTFIVSLVRQLMIVFRVHFGAEPGYTKKDNEGDSDGSAIIDSPFIRFVEQVCDELNITKSNGEPYTRATFADAVRKARKL